MNKTFYIMCGIPGSGKSHWAQNLATASTQSEVISSDDIRQEINGDSSSQLNGKAVWDNLYERVRTTRKELVIVDATFIYRRDREKIINFIRVNHPGALVNCFFLSTSLEMSLAQNVNRDRYVPETIVESFHSRLQIPTPEEGFDRIFNVGDCKYDD